LGSVFLLAYVLKAAKSIFNLIQFIMKKILLSAVAVLAMIACEKKEKTVESTEVNKETEVVTTPPDTIVKTENVEDPDGTSVSVSSDGINVSSKNDDNKTEVNVDAKK
jgi:hypothetical protein